MLAAREGASVACWDRDEPAARATARLVTQASGAAVVVVADASDPEACSEAMAEAVAGLGGIDGLVLNVGIGRGAGLSGTSADDWDTTFAVNVRAHFLACKAAVPLMPPGSAIVFISSVAGLTPGSRIPSYDSSKAALAGLCRHVAAEGARKQIRANVVAPGLIDTPLGRRPPAGVPRPHTRSARSPGLGLGGCRRCRLAPVGTIELCHRPGARRRRRPQRAHLGSWQLGVGGLSRQVAWWWLGDG